MYFTCLFINYYTVFIAVSINCYLIKYRAKQKHLLLYHDATSNDELKEIDIKNHMCYYFDDIIKIEDFDFDVLIDEKSHEDILVYSISYKTLIGAKLLRIRFNKVNEFIRVYDGTRYLVLFGDKKYDII